jgi:hypothetical protein
VQGAPFLKGYLQTNLREVVERKAAVIQHWIDEGKAGADRPVSPDLPDLGGDTALRGFHPADQGGHECIPAQPDPFPQG